MTTSQQSVRRSRKGHAAPPLTISFEFFPPRTPEMTETLWAAIRRLEPMRPAFVSVTYGAGGGTRTRTHQTIERILGETALDVAAHLTCIAATREEIDAVVESYRALGVRRIVALRGDPINTGGEGAGASTAYAPDAAGYGYASDLVAAIRRAEGGSGFDIAVAGYPECHPESAGWQTELDNLKKKVDAGADRIITQYFFENDLFEAYCARVAAAGITIPVVPGILPIQNYAQTVVFSARCGASIPEWLAYRFAGLENDPGTRKLVGASIACEQVMDLVDRGVTEFHFYTMNRADLTFAICHMLGMGRGA